MSKIHTEIDISNIQYKCEELYYSFRELFPYKSLIKEVIDNLETDSQKLKFVSISTAYEENNGAKDVATSPSMTPTPKHNNVKYHWL